MPGVHDLLPNLGDQNVSQNGMAFIINGHRAAGSTVEIGRANTLQPTGSPGGVIVANAPSVGASQPGTYVAPDTNDVTPDQRALVKAYFNQNTGAQ
ncbi:MAG: hypothetical protein NVSMB65_20690 [Chloroflexota bacterium]